MSVCIHTQVMEIWTTEESMYVLRFENSRFALAFFRKVMPKATCRLIPRSEYCQYNATGYARLSVRDEIDQQSTIRKHTSCHTLSEALQPECPYAHNIPRCSSKNASSPESPCP